MRKTLAIAASLAISLASPSSHAQDSSLKKCRALGLIGLAEQWLKLGMVEANIVDFCDDYGTLHREVSSSSEALTLAVSQIQDLEARLDASEKTIDVLEARSVALQEELKRTRDRLPPQKSILLVDDTDGCPTGWTNMAVKEPAFFAGRTIVAAGFEASRVPREFRDRGGEEEVTLTKPQMPEHKHSVSIHEGAGQFNFLAGAQNPYGIDPKFYDTDGKKRVLEEVLELNGGNQPHNNMPPYIALYFCKKD